MPRRYVQSQTPPGAPKKPRSERRNPPGGQVVCKLNFDDDNVSSA